MSPFNDFRMGICHYKIILKWLGTFLLFLGLHVKITCFCEFCVKSDLGHEYDSYLIDIGMLLYFIIIITLSCYYKAGVQIS